MDTVIFGAQGIALSAYEAITTLYPDQNVRCFLVSERGINATTLAGIQVIEISEFAKEMTSEEKDKIEVIIATPENVQAEIKEILESYGFHNYWGLDAVKSNELLKAFHLKKGVFLPLEFASAERDYANKIVEKNACLDNDQLSEPCNDSMAKVGSGLSLEIYMARHEKDKKLTQEYIHPGYVVPIQVGAEGSIEKICDFTDNTGVNISYKNGNYSELTALYWLWKNKLGEQNAKSYYGLFQYRRVLMLSNDGLKRLSDGDVDVILPHPMPYEPDINAHHDRYLKNVDWNAMLTALSEIHPDYADYFLKILGQKYLYNYNIIIARRAILKDYCEWLFPILERTEELSEPKGADRSDRYIGYMGETLETLFFMKNSDKLRIRYTGYRMLL